MPVSKTKDRSSLFSLTLMLELREERTRKVNLDNLSVWCTDKNEWRSFKIANVTRVEQIG